MHQVIIYDSDGIPIDGFEINDTISSIDGRVSLGEKKFYKGIGVEYSGHWTTQPNERHVNVTKSDVFYVGYHVYDMNYIGKRGIFKERYQPQFTDFIGGCGVKELSIIENSMFFDKSSVQVIKSHKIDGDQYWFELDYKCRRRKYLSGGFPLKLIELMEYMLKSDWNFVWDKDSITDISYNGLVTDVADIFYSNTMESKFGTVYSIIYSLGRQDHKMYQDLIKRLRLKHTNNQDYVFNTVKILKKCGIAVDQIEQLNYKQILLNYLVVGRNCGHCVLDGLGEQIKQQYVNEVNIRNY